MSGRVIIGPGYPSIYAGAVTGMWGIRGCKLRPGRPATDGSTIFMPSIRPPGLTEDEWEHWAASLSHECIHVIRGTAVRFKDEVQKRGDPWFRDILNVVLDVQDETWLGFNAIATHERVGASRLQQQANLRYSLSTKGYLLSLGHAEIKPGDGKSVVMALIKAGMHYGWGHSKPPRGMETAFVGGIPYGMAVKTLLKTAHKRSSVNPRSRRGRRNRMTDAEWAKAIAITEEIVAMLPPPESGYGGGGQPGEDGGSGLTGPPLNTDGSVGTATVSIGDRTVGDVEAAADAQSEQASGEKSKPGEAAGAKAGDGDPGYDFCRRTYRDALFRLGPAIAQIAEMGAPEVVTGETMGRLAQPHRLRIDGRAFSTKTGDCNEGGVAVAILLDTSGSMAGSLPQVSAIAEACAAALEGVCDSVQRHEFGHQVGPVTTFKTVNCGGGTPMGECLSRAKPMLLAEPYAKKFMLIVTDGEPYSRDEVREILSDAARRDIRTMFICWDDRDASRLVERCKELLPPLARLQRCAVAGASTMYALARAIGRAAEEVLR